MACQTNTKGEKRAVEQSIAARCKSVLCPSPPAATLQEVPRQNSISASAAAMSDSTPKSYSSDPILYLYTSLTSGSSHIVTATSRLETILKANRIPFKALDIATDEKARMLWGRRSGKDESGRVRKIPGLVQMGLVLGV